MKKVFLYTVPGTGTRFTRKFLEDVLGYKRVEVEAFRSAGSGVMTAGHALHPSVDGLFDLFASGAVAVVSTLREPYLAGISSPHGNRSKNPMQRMHGPLIDKMKEKPVKQWNALIAVWDRLEAEGQTMAFMQVDEDDPDKRRAILENIAEHVGADYDQGKFDAYLNAWEPVGKSYVGTQKQEYLDSGTIGGEALTHLEFAISWSTPRRVIGARPPKPPKPVRRGPRNKPPATPTPPPVATTPTVRTKPRPRPANQGR